MPPPGQNTGRNASPVTPDLSPLAEANVRDWYAIDAQLLEGLA